jgi:hypothetical protein
MNDSNYLHTLLLCKLLIFETNYEKKHIPAEKLFVIIYLQTFIHRGGIKGYL